MAGDIYIEENGYYQIDCTAAVWSTDGIHNTYHSAGNSFLCDVDFIAETEDRLFLIEYKNANIPGAVHPEAFNPAEPQNIEKVARKFYDSLHYLNMQNKRKRIKFIFIVEYPKAGSPERKLLRNRIAERLPFTMQEGMPRPLINDFDVVSISEWNHHAEYSQFPLTPIT